MKINPVTSRPAGPQTRLSRPVQRGLDRIGNFLFPHPERLLGRQPALAGGPPISLMTIEGNPGGSGAGQPQISRDELVNLLQKLNYPNIGQVEKSLQLHKKLPAPRQEKNLRLAFKMTEWGGSSAIIAAALLIGTELESVKDKEVVRLLKNFGELDRYSCYYEHKKQVSHLQSLLFLAAESHEVLLLITAQDLLDLESFAPIQYPATLSLFEQTDLSTRSPLEAQAKRAFFVTSWILKYLEYRNEGGTLEDLALLHLNPKKYREVEQKLQEEMGMNRLELLDQLGRIASDLDALCELTEISCTIKYRVKRIASLITKIEIKNKSLDVNGVRIVLDSDRAEDCYLALFRLREYFKNEGYWEEVTEEYDDYIAYPKPNGYRSIHVVFRDINGYTLEAQIRTKKMDHLAEFGQASHAGYKTGEETTGVVAFLPIAQQRFAAKKDQLTEQGTCLVYDVAGLLYNLVTGDRRERPSLLDFAFAQELRSGLYTRDGLIDGQHAVIDARLRPGAAVVIRTEGRSDPLLHDRAKKVFTPLARSILTAAATGKMDPYAQLDEDQLQRKGNTIFQNFLSAMEKELEPLNAAFSRRPNLRFSLERLLNRRGFASEREFFTTLGLLAEKDSFFAEIREHILSNLVLLSSQISGRATSFELLATRKQSGAFLNMLALLDKHGLKLKSLRQRPLPRSEYARIDLEVLSTRQQSEDFQADIENLYLGMQPPHSQRGRVLRLNLRIAKSGESLRPILEALFRINANITCCHIPEVLPRQDLFIELTLQFPEGISKKRSIDSLTESLGKIRGIGQIIVT